MGNIIGKILSKIGLFPVPTLFESIHNALDKLIFASTDQATVGYLMNFRVLFTYERVNEHLIIKNLNPQNEISFTHASLCNFKLVALKDAHTAISTLHECPLSIDSKISKQEILAIQAQCKEYLHQRHAQLYLFFISLFSGNIKEAETIMYNDNCYMELPRKRALYQAQLKELQEKGIDKNVLSSFNKLISYLEENLKEELKEELKEDIADTASAFESYGYNNHF
ncbi:MAG: hypothetical protein WC627_12480 [Legionella sp.]|jgi:hypothetical protein